MKKKLNCILLIEDNEFTNIYNQKLIKNLGITEHVYLIENGEEGLDFIFGRGKYNTAEVKFHNPDLIFLDFNIQGLNAWEFFETYNKLNKEKILASKIVMLTTSLSEEDELKLKQIKEIAFFNGKTLNSTILGQIMREYFADFL